VRLRLRAPLGFVLSSVSVTGRSDVALAVDQDCVIFPSQLKGQLDLVTRWTAEGRTNPAR